ncbi:hypothetical protein [Streptomyces bambusae]|uniref:Uncharacterized protein n=1 Tax=Streptomyces bambusae TaxID=1550616 RepID=A0ABS6YZK2_9ACTN|nr:hypothetical protein [Streptomyces bambusae]MBW5480912.1 hypothetical protein [Streptomyces bambusae]
MPSTCPISQECPVRSTLLGTRLQDAPDALRKRLDSLAAGERGLGRLREAELRDRAQQLARRSRRQGR